MQGVESTSDLRTVNNTVRHQYRILSDEEKAQVTAIKDKGLEFLALIESLYPKPEPADAGELLPGVICRELSIATERVEEAVMWAVKHITK